MVLDSDFGSSNVNVAQVSRGTFEGFAGMVVILFHVKHEIVC